MSNRKLQEREVFPNGVSTEWDDCSAQPEMWGKSDGDWNKLVRGLNAKAKSDGEYTRFRSVEGDD